MIAQSKIYRAVAGAVRNTAHGHPDWAITPTMAHSIAKRATGTLLALVPGALAAERPSDQAGVAARTASAEAHAAPGVLLTKVPRRARGPSCPKGVTTLRGRSPLHLLWGQIGVMAGEARRSGQMEREKALVEVLRLIAQARKEAKIR